MITRRNIRNLSQTEVNQFRRAFELLYALDADDLQDFRSYCTVAGIHGIPGRYCPHGSPLFLTWHRAYMYNMEQTMQQVLEDKDFALPYWDWASEISQQNGIPDAFTAVTYINDDGDELPNPLLSAVKCYDGVATRRNPGSPAALGNLAVMVQNAMNATSYNAVNSGIENPHNGLHGWTGGDMGNIGTAAYDPIFWAHHSNVDRYWWQWQQTHPGVNPPQLQAALSPFGMTVSDVLTTDQLGYSYAASERVIVAEPEKVTVAAAMLNEALGAINIGELDGGHDMATVQIKGIAPPEKTYALNVYLNSPEADEKTPTVGNSSYAGTIYFFGHGDCTGGPGHCEVTPTYGRMLARPDHSALYDKEIDISECLQGAYKNGGSVQVNFVAVDPDGERLDLDRELQATSIGVKFED